MRKLELLRRFEPVFRFTDGEMFFPMAVDEYLRACCLWLTGPSGGGQLIASSGELDVDSLSRYQDAPRGHTVYLRFVPEPMSGTRYRVWKARKRAKFSAPARMARVPLLSRLVDSLFSLSLAVRGKVPGGTAAAAHQRYRRLLQNDPRRTYYGRVLREDGWIVLHYLYFYPMNNWRSGFNGVNDHEADWEQALVYLYESSPGDFTPEWVAYSSHEFDGGDQRRRWDDPDLDKEGSHPVIYVAAGSHAGYFQAGEYLMAAPPQFSVSLRKLSPRFRTYWARGIRAIGSYVERELSISQVPYIDYARGDGMTIGPGGDEPWTPLLLTGDEEWIVGYRGLWGLDTLDPIEGERAPAGPKYERDGSTRLSWIDPLAWAGLEQVYPPNHLAAQVRTQVSEIGAKIRETEKGIQTTQAELRALALEVQALEMQGRFGTPRRKRLARIERLEHELLELRFRCNDLFEMQGALQKHLVMVESGRLGDPKSHLRSPAIPEPPLQRRNRMVELWAAVSSTLILLGLVSLIVIRPPNWLALVIGSGLAVGAIEAVTRRWIVKYIRTLTLILAFIASIVLLVELWEIAVGMIISGLALFILRENLRELMRN